jgi:DNA-directed RNA polymerase specialized sigma24 family protein
MRTVDATQSPSLAGNQDDDTIDFARLAYLNVISVQLKLMPRAEQHALRRIEVDGASYASAATELGISRESFAVLVLRGRRRILDASRRHPMAVVGYRWGRVDRMGS